MLKNGADSQKELTFGHYEATLLSQMPTEKSTVSGARSAEPKDDDVLYVTAVVKKPEDAHLVPLSAASPESKASSEVKLTEEESQKLNKHTKGIISFSEMAKLTLPKLLRDKLNKAHLPSEAHPEHLFTEEQRKAIYEAIEQDKSHTVKKIRRVKTGKPGEKKERAEKSSAPFTELEKKLNLEFSIIIDNDRQPIALFRGKSYESPFEDEDESDYLVGKGFNVVKFGQRLSDGKWVAVKIKKYNIQGVNALKAMLKNAETAYSDAFTRLKQMGEDDTTPDSEYFDQMAFVTKLKEQVLAKQEEIEKLEKTFKTDINRETEFLSEAEMHLGEAARESGNVAKIYNVQVLLEGQEFYEYMSHNEPKTYIRDVGERLDALLLALQDLKKLHDKNIIHGDLKPDNMIYLRDSSPRYMKIIDYESSVKLNPGEQTAKAMRKATEMYRAPEIMQGVIHKGSDIYSMGRMLEYFIYEEKYFPEINRHPILKSEIHSLIKKMQESDFTARPNVDTVIKEIEEIIHRHKSRAEPSASKP